MRVLFIIGILFLFGASSVSSASIIVKRGVVSLEEQNQIIRGLNKLREMTANNGVANMHELVWNPSFATKAGEMTCASKDVTGPNYIVVPAPDPESIEKLAQRDMNTVATLFALILHPVQSSIGCATLTPPCVQNGITATHVCLIGPKNKFEQTDGIRGPAGSQCPNGKGPTGLCTAPPTAAQITYSSAHSSLVYISILFVFFMLLE